MKRGIYFTLDGIFAAFIIIAAVALLLSFTQSTPDTTQFHTTSADMLAILDTLTMGELNSSIAADVLATNLTNESDTVLRAIAVLWALNNSLAENFTQSVLGEFTTQYSYAVYAEDTRLAGVEYSPQSSARIIASTKQQVSGIALGRPLAGSTASAFLQKIENKTTSTFVYFGGFVGQGNLSFILANLPSDITNETIRSVTLEMDTPSPFTLLINGQACGYYIPQFPQNSTIEKWSITQCYDAFTTGNNSVLLAFNATLDESYISGGLMRVQYTTNMESQDPYSTPKIVSLPGIEGIVNLYDAFYVPGNVTNMTVYLHYFANHTGALANNSFYLTIGNVTVYRDSTSNTTQTITLNNTNLTQLNYSQLSNVTVPVRIGFENLTFSSVFTGNANVMLVTDVSGSMDWNFTTDWGAGVRRECANPLINASSTQRLSLAKCLDKQFAQDILNVTGNLLGLVSYEDTTVTAATVPLTTNLTRINQTIGNTTSGYTPLGGTCICCGINSAVAQLNASVLKTTFIQTGATWSYRFFNQTLLPPGNDTNNNPWYAVKYSNASSWASGPAVLGSAENGTGPAIVTDMGNTLTTAQYVPDLWERAADNTTPVVDFTSGLNSTGNTFGIAGADDGWNWQGGVYGYDNDINFRGVVNGALRMDLNTTGNDNNCANNDCSGAYGVEFNITPALWSVIQSNGSVRLSFSYSWTSNPTNPFDTNDDVWIKARISNSTTTTYLGSELSSQGGDNTIEVDRRTNPDIEFSSSYTADVTSFITGPGSYFLDFGGKLQANSDDEWGFFTFDNVLMGITNSTDVYYLRANFTINNLSLAQTGILNVLADDRATVYLNGVLLTDEAYAHDPEYWNVRGFIVPEDRFVQGTNVLAVRIENFRGTTKFDARLEGLNTTKSLAMLILTDGVANQECSAQNTGDASEDAILAACQAKERWGATVHTVGFSLSADNQTLEEAAVCGGGTSVTSANTTELSQFYTNVVLHILDSSVRSQSILVTGSYQPSVLYNDSYIRFDYTPYAPALQTNEITVTTQTPPFSSCTPTAFINPAARVLSAQFASYSGTHWTSMVSANGNVVYNLSKYSTPFIALGDPFIVEMPINTLVPGTNNLVIETADSPLNTTGCSQNNSLITTLAIPLTTSRTAVLAEAEGCTWTVERDDLTTYTVRVPTAYSGGNTCSYTNTSISYNSEDAYDAAIADLLRSLDYDVDGRVFISLSEQDIEIIVSKVSQVPYMWGPSRVEVRVWQ